MGNEVIRFGVIGTNNITDWFLDGANHVKNFALTAVHSRTEEKAKEFAQKHNAKYTFTSLQEMAESDVIDAVYIASPNALHAQQAILFLHNKKHVLCEKAFASNAAEVAKMIETAKRNNVILMEAMKTTQFPNFKAVKENLHRIGKIRKCLVSYCQYSSRYDKYKEGIVLNAFKPELSNGALMDIGVYCIHPLVNLFGKPNTVKANSIMLESGVDGDGNLLLGYGDMQAVAIYSKITNSILPSEIQGEDGNILIERINNFEKVTIVFKDGRKEDLSQEQVEDNMCYEIDKFIGLVNNKNMEERNKLLQISQGVMEIMDETRKQVGLVFPADNI